MIVSTIVEFNSSKLMITSVETKFKFRSNTSIYSLIFLFWNLGEFKSENAVLVNCTLILVFKFTVLLQFNFLSIFLLPYGYLHFNFIDR